MSIAYPHASVCSPPRREGVSMRSFRRHLTNIQVTRKQIWSTEVRYSTYKALRAFDGICHDSKYSYAHTTSGFAQSSKMKTASMAVISNFAKTFRKDTEGLFTKWQRSTQNNSGLNAYFRAKKRVLSITHTYIYVCWSVCQHLRMEMHRPWVLLTTLKVLSQDKNYRSSLKANKYTPPFFKGHSKSGPAWVALTAFCSRNIM